jgi:hypothetical protein
MARQRAETLSRGVPRVAELDSGLDAGSDAESRPSSDVDTDTDPELDVGSDDEGEQLRQQIVFHKSQGRARSRRTPWSNGLVGKEYANWIT